MAQNLTIHPTHPQERLIQKAIEVITVGGLIVFPTDSGYALGCQMGEKNALERMRRLRELSPRHHFTLMCRDLSEIALYAHVNNPLFRLLKAHTPGSYTFILSATKEVPRRMLQKRNTIGIRIPDNPIALSLLGALGEPMISSSLIMPGDTLPLPDPETIAERLDERVDLIINGGHCGVGPTTIVDLTTDAPEIIREGRGDVAAILS